MNKLFFGMTALAVALLLPSCENDDTDFSSVINGSGSTSTTVTPRTVAIDSTALDEGDEVIPTSASDEAYDDYIENSSFDYTVNVAYSENSVSLSGDVSRITYTTDGANLVVKSLPKGMNLCVSGTSTNGSLKVYSNYKYALTLQGLTLTNPNGSAINNQSGKTLFVVLAEGYYNSILDGSSYTMVSGEDQKATLFSEGQIIFSGKGVLNVNAVGKNGIASDDYVRFRKGNRIYVNSTAGNGVKANDGIFISGGVLNIEVSANGAKGLNSEDDIVIDGGRTTIMTSGGTTISAGDTTSVAGIKSDSLFVLKSGVVNIKSTGEGGKGIKADCGVNVLGGELTVVTLGTKTYSSPKGIKSDADITISGGKTYSYSQYDSPMDANGATTVSSGYTTYENEERYINIEF